MPENANRLPGFTAAQLRAATVGGPATGPVEILVWLGRATTAQVGYVSGYELTGGRPAVKNAAGAILSPAVAPSLSLHVLVPRRTEDAPAHAVTAPPPAGGDRD